MQMTDKEGIGTGSEGAYLPLVLFLALTSTLSLIEVVTR